MAKRSARPPMTLGNMRHLGVQHLIATCLSDACRHQGLIDVSKYTDDTEVPWFASKIVRAKCGARGRYIDVRASREAEPDRQAVEIRPSALIVVGVFMFMFIFVR